MIEGIDVSSANLVPTWSEVPEELAFAYIRATHGKARDGRLTAHWNACVMASRMCGAYTFEEPDDDPLDEVAAFVDTDAVHMVLPPALDVEWLGGRTPKQVLTYTRGFLDDLEKRIARVPMIYTGPSFWMNLGAEAKHPDFARYPLWIAHYGAAKPIVPAPWDRWTFWQDRANTIVQTPDGKQLFGTPARKALAEIPGAKIIAQPGIVKGVQGEVDHNFYNGTIDDLKKLAGF